MRVSKKNNKTKNKSQSNSNSQNKKDSLNVMNTDSSVALQFTIRHPKEEKGIIVSDSDWDDIKDANEKLKNVNNAYYTWSGVCFSTSITLLLSVITIICDKMGDVFKYIPFYVMSALFIVAIIVGIILIVKGKGKASTVESAIHGLNIVIRRIERKTSGLENISYYGE